MREIAIIGREDMEIVIIGPLLIGNQGRLRIVRHGPLRGENGTQLNDFRAPSVTFRYHISSS